MDELPVTPHLCVEDGTAAPVSLVLRVPNCLAATERARSRGTRVTRGPDDQGERVVATIIDPAGHRWQVEEH